MTPKIPRHIEDLEKKLILKPESLSLLEELLWVYLDDPALYSHPNRINHILSYIKQSPRTPTARTPYVCVDPNLSQEGFKAIESEWVNLLKENPNDAIIARGAANFYSTKNTTQSTEILHKIVDNEENQPEIWLDLGRFTTNASERLRYLIKARQLGSEQPNLLVWISQFAVEAKDFKTAESVGLELLSLVEEARTKYGAKVDWSEIGNAMWEKALEATGDKRKASELTSAISAHAYHKHWGHTALGHVALHRNDLASAIEHLKESCKVVGDCRLSSYGPSFSLAEELCNRGAWSEVAFFLQTCKSFWNNECLDLWHSQVERQELPDFK